ncbi:MAG: threonine--tRNA ligase [Clostridia bacterium]|nr:threonine--tRNA ligase [Clostridia bacterium]
MILTLRDEKKEFDAPVSIEDIAKGISEGLGRAAICGMVDGKLVDLSYVVDHDADVRIITMHDEEAKRVYNHTCAHVLAQAVKAIFPTAKLAIGPAIENGFYYDFDFKTAPTADDLDKIEAEMKKIIKANLPMKREEVSREEALKLMGGFDETYKVELISDIPEGEAISLYRQGDFVDLCAGPHLKSTGIIKAFKLISITGAYWRGNEKNKMLTRIYGIAFDKKADLEAYLTKLEEAKKRDHNKLGRELGYFMTSDIIGQGLPLLMPKGAKIVQILQRFVEDEEERRGYMLTKTPYMAKSDLYKISGHWDHYRDKMFILGDPDDEQEAMALRPMTCPFQYQIYNNGLKSYRDLPVRFAETATLFRKEASGEMHGLIRVRQFTLADGHTICTADQIDSEFKRALEMSYYFLDCVGLREDVTFRFSKWDPNNTEKYINDPEAWEATQNMMRNILDNLGLKYVEADDEAAFYGPKLDVQAKNVHGKEDTIITIQIDFASAARFGMTYIDENGQKATPYIIHRSSIGCYERTLAMLIEKYAGAMPVWLSPVQAKVISLTERNVDAVKELTEKLQRAGVRAEMDIRNEKVQRKVRDAQVEKIPYMLVLGDRDIEKGVVSVRDGRAENSVTEMTADDFIALIRKKFDEKK